MTGTGRMFFIGMLVCLLGACASPKDVVYLQDVKINSRVKAALQYRTVIHVDDLFQSWFPVMISRRPCLLTRR